MSVTRASLNTSRTLEALRSAAVRSATVVVTLVTPATAVGSRCKVQPVLSKVISPATRVVLLAVAPLRCSTPTFL